MSLSKEWTEWHLTPRGWESGSERIDFSGITSKEPPVDRVVTYRWIEEQTSAFSRMHCKHEKVWEAGDKAAINQLLKQYGGAPSHL